MVYAIFLTLILIIRVSNSDSFDDKDEESFVQNCPIPDNDQILLRLTRNDHPLRERY